MAHTFGIGPWDEKPANVTYHDLFEKFLLGWSITSLILLLVGMFI